jgi:hypothetical protein
VRAVGANSLWISGPRPPLGERVPRCAGAGEGVLEVSELSQDWTYLDQARRSEQPTLFELTARDEFATCH